VISICPTRLAEAPKEMNTAEKPAMNRSELTTISLRKRLRSSAFDNCSIESPLM
jgi:hypothetical protein